MTDDLRLIEDYLPIEAISAEASREKSVRKGHISTLHLWWARRPLVACRAAVFGALVPADWPSRFRKAKEEVDSQLHVETDPDQPKTKAKVPNRATSAAFVTHLCKYPGSPRAIATAQRIIGRLFLSRTPNGSRSNSTTRGNNSRWERVMVREPLGRMTHLVGSTNFIGRETRRS